MPATHHLNVWKLLAIEAAQLFIALQPKSSTPEPPCGVTVQLSLHDFTDSPTCTVAVLFEITCPELSCPELLAIPTWLAVQERSLEGPWVIQSLCLVVPIASRHGGDTSDPTSFGRGGGGVDIAPRRCGTHPRTVTVRLHRWTDGFVVGYRADSQRGRGCRVTLSC